jgi:hypothetical protein
MNALINIENKARVIVEQLADKEINRMEDLYNGFVMWMEVPGNAIISPYGHASNPNPVDTYGSVEKYVYMTQYKKWDRELNQYVSPTEYPTTYRERREMYYDKQLVNMVGEIRLMAQGQEESYRKSFIGANMMKLNRALAKHLTNDMTASDIKVNVGGDGAEVTANVDGKLFKTFGTLCGGWVQCLHYRYRSSLK